MDMLIVAGRLEVDAESRDGYLASCVDVIRSARAADGCLDFCLSADPLQETRVNIFERWDSEEKLLQFRGSGPSGDQAAKIRNASVARYVISSVEEV